MQSTLQILLSVIDKFPWSLSVSVIVISAMVIFRRPVGELISRSHELKAGRYLSLKAKPSGLDPRAVAEVIREMRESAASQEKSDVDRLVIRDSKGRPRILASTKESGEAFLALLDEDGEVRVSLVAESAAAPDALAMLILRGKGQPAGDLASFIGADRDGSGAVAVLDKSGFGKKCPDLLRADMGRRTSGRQPPRAAWLADVAAR